MDWLIECLQQLNANWLNLADLKSESSLIALYAIVYDKLMDVLGGEEHEIEIKRHW